MDSNTSSEVKLVKLLLLSCIMLQFYASIILTSGDGVLLINYVLSNEIQTMFPQLAKQPGDLFTDHPLYNQRSVVLRKKKLKKGNWRSDIISLYYSLVTLKCTNFTCNCISLFRHFLLNSFLCRVWNMQHITNNSHQRVELE